MDDFKKSQSIKQIKTEFDSLRTPSSLHHQGSTHKNARGAINLQLVWIGELDANGDRSGSRYEHSLWIEYCHMARLQ